MVRRSRRLAFGICLLAVIAAVVGAGALVAAASSRAEDASASAPTVVRELPSKRTEYSNTYLLSDGQYRCVGYESPVNFEASDGSWQPIDTSLMPEGGHDVYATTATPVEVTVADEAPGRRPVTVSDGDWTVTMNLVGLAEDEKSVANAVAVFQDVAPATDVTYTVLGDGLREVITLASPAAPHTFTYRITHPGLALRQDTEGGWALYAPHASKPVFVVGPMSVCDSSLDAADEPAWSEGAEMTVTPGEGASSITYAVAREWMNDPARVYPIKIDPDLGNGNTLDTYLSLGLPAQSFGSSEDLLCGRMNSDADKCRTLVQFPQVNTDIPAGADITASAFRLRQYWQPATHQDTVYIGRLGSGAWWTESSTYNGANGRMTIQSTFDPQTVSGTSVWMSVDCGSVVRDWFLNGANNGFIVYEPDSSGSGYSRKFRSKEYAGTTYDPNLNVTYAADQGAPATTSSGLQASQTTGWRNTSQSVALSASDPANGSSPGSGVAHTYYKLDGGSQTTYSAAFDVSGAGQHAVEYWTVDVAGNAETHHTGYVNIDLAAPATTASGLQADDHSGWRTASQAVSLSASDAASGVAHTYYKLDGGSQTTYSAAFDVSGAGQHAIEYWSVDVAGNAETHHTGYVNIDLAVPATTASGLQADDHSGWRTASQAVSLSASDAASGVAHTYYKLDGGSQTTYSAAFDVSGAGQHAIEYWSVDVAGNAETHHTGYVNIDLAVPATTASGLQADDHSGWRTASQAVSLSASDAASGVAHTYYKLDGGSQTTYSAAFDVSGAGQHAIEYWSVDVAGNAETHHTGYVNIDLAAPATTASGLQADDHSGWRTASQAVSLSASDAASGVAHTYYKLDGGSQTTYSAAFDVSGAGQHAVEYWSVDVAGNAETHHTGYVNIFDGQPNVTSPNGGETWLADSSHAITWTVPQALPLGHFEVWAVNAALSTSTCLASNVAVTSSTSYSYSWQVSEQAASGWRMRIVYDDASGEAARDESDASFTISECTPTITAPNGGESYLQGSTQTVSWTVPAPVGSGSFMVNADRSDQSSTCLGWVDADGGSSYSFPYDVRQEAGSDYRIRITYYDAQNVARASDVSDGLLTVVDCLPTVTSPNGGELWQKGSTQDVTWSVAHPATSGTYVVSLHNPASFSLLRSAALSRIPSGSVGINAVVPSGTDIELGEVPADGSLTYSMPWTVDAPVADGWQAYVKLECEDGQPVDGDYSDEAFSIAECEPVVTAPNGGEVLQQGSEQYITWSMSPAVESGHFSVTLQSGDGDPIVLDDDVAATGAETYELPWTVSQEAGDEWHVRVSYFDESDAEVASDWSDAGFEILHDIVVTQPSGQYTMWISEHGYASAWASWTCASELDGGVFAVWLVDSSGQETLLGTRDALPVLSPYYLMWTLPQTPGDYRLHITHGPSTSEWTGDGWSPTFTVRQDTIAPTSSISGVDDLWHDSDVTVTLSATDEGGAGVSDIQGKVDDGPWHSVGDPFSIPALADHSNDGDHVVSYRAYDRAGNVEDVRTAHVRIGVEPIVDGPVGTKILYCPESVNVYSYTPTGSGQVTASLSWTSPGISGSPALPDAGAGLVVQGADVASEESYLPFATTDGAANPSDVTVLVSDSGLDGAATSGQPLYFTVRPLIGEADYHLSVTYAHEGTSEVVLDETGTATGTAGRAYLETSGTIHSVLQTWPHSANNVSANWDASIRQGSGSDVWRDKRVTWSTGSTKDFTFTGPGFAPMWLVINPFVAETAVSPNSWTRSWPTDRYPRPGSLSADESAAWATYSYPVNQAATETDGWDDWSQARSYPVGYALASATASQSSAGSCSWADTGSLSSSGAGARGDSEQGPAIDYRFYGDSCTWKYATTPQSGILSIYVDGVQAATVDQYSAATQYGQQTTVSGFAADEFHSLHIVPTGEKNAASSGYLLSHDAFVARTDADDPATVSEDNSDGATFYSWATCISTTAHGGAFAYTSSVAAATACTFSGDAVTWQYGIGPNCGIADVTIDGVSKGQVDQYGAQLTVGSGQRVTYQGLGSGLHTMLIVASDSKNAASSGNYLISDEFESFNPATGQTKHTEAETPPPVEVSSDVVVLDDATVSAITSYSAEDPSGVNTITFGSATTQLQAVRTAFSAGHRDILVVNKCEAYPHGLARRVDSFPSSTQVQTKSIVPTELYVNGQPPQASFAVTDAMIAEAAANGGVLTRNGWIVVVDDTQPFSNPGPSGWAWMPAIDADLHGVGGEVKVTGDFHAGNFGSSLFDRDDNRGDVACDNLAFTAYGNVSFADPTKFSIYSVESSFPTGKLPVVATGDGKVIALGLDIGERWDCYVKVYGHVASGSCLYLDGETEPGGGFGADEPPRDRYGFESFVWQPICAQYLTPAAAAAGSDTSPSGAPGGICPGEKAPTSLTENQQITGPALFTYAIGLQRTGTVGWSPDPFDIIHFDGDEAWSAVERYCRLHCDYAASPRADIVTGVDWSGDDGTVLSVPGHEAAPIWESSTVAERFPVTTYEGVNPVVSKSYGDKLWMVSEGAPNLLARDIKSDPPSSELVCPLRSCPHCGGLVFPYQADDTCPLCSWVDPDPSGPNGFFRTTSPFGTGIDGDTVAWIESSGPYYGYPPNKTDIYFRSLSSTTPETRVLPRADDGLGVANYPTNVAVAAKAHLVVASGQPDNGGGIYSDHNVSAFSFGGDGSRGPQFLIRTTGSIYYDRPGPFVVDGSLGVVSVDEDTAFVLWEEYYQDAWHGPARDITWWGSFVHASTGVVEPPIAVLLPGQGDSLGTHDMGFANDKVTLVFEKESQIYGIDINRSAGTTGSPYLISDDDDFSPRTLPLPLSLMTHYNPKIAVSGGQRVVLWDAHWSDEDNNQFFGIQALNLETHKGLNANAGPEQSMQAIHVVGISGRDDVQSGADAKWRLVWREGGTISSTVLDATDF